MYKIPMQETYLFGILEMVGFLEELLSGLA
jgi:hypothetical protein